MPRRTPDPPSDLPPELREAIAAMSLDELRGTTAQLLSLVGGEARIEPGSSPRRHRRARAPFAVTVRVDLVGAKPPVWRRLVLPSTLRLDQLHGVLQAVFDWSDSHLHRFVLGKDEWGSGEKYLCPYDVESGDEYGVPASDVRVDEVLAAPGDVLNYVYDYGDNWHHLLVVEKVGPPVAAVELVTGRGSAPPEDSGGIWGWNAEEAPPFDLAEAQVALAMWSTTRSLPPELLTLRQHLAGTPQEATLLELLGDAGLDQPVTEDATVVEAATAPYRWLLHRVGTRIRLTAAGWLPPALVTEAMDTLWPTERWWGKGNREDLTGPVRQLRASAQSAGLLRLSRGELVVTKTGAALRDDPRGLFLHLAERLPGRLGTPFARTAVPLVLAAVAAGRSHYGPVAELLTAAGWGTRARGAVDLYAPAQEASHAIEVLAVAGAWDGSRASSGSVTPAGRALAHAALVGWR